MTRLLVIALLIMAAGPVAADDPTAQARTYFSAGAKAYAAGEFSTAIRAFELAYQLAPRAGILFSLGQAERRQYFVDRDLDHLRRAVEAFRHYLDGEEQGGRRAEAADALSELEPLLSRRASVEPALAPANPGPLVTRLMVTSPNDGAQVALDDKAAREAPYIQEVAPGTHRVRVSAPGYLDESREVPLTLGALVALDLSLKEQPARLRLLAPAGAAVSIDGQALGNTPFSEALTIAPGMHRLSLQQRGRVGYAELLSVNRGEEITRSVELAISPQRVVAGTTIGLGIACLMGGGTLTAVALVKQTQATGLLRQQQAGTLSGSGLSQYVNLRSSRDQLRLAAEITAATGAFLVFGGWALWRFDNPSGPDAASARTIQIGVSPQGPAAVGQF